MNTKTTLRPSTVEPRSDPPPWAVSGLEDAVEEWLTSYYAASPKTVLIYRAAVGRAMLPHLLSQGAIELNDVSPKHLTLFLVHEWERPRKTQRRDGDRGDAGKISTEVIVRTYEIMKTFWKWCVGQGYISRSPMDGVRKPAKPVLTREALSTQGAKDLLAIVRAKDDPIIRARDEALVTLFLDTGLRANELRGLRLGDIDWANRRLLLRDSKGKGTVQARIKIGPKAYQSLRAWLRQREKYKVSSDAVWLSQRRAPMGYQAVWHVIHRLGEYSGQHAFPHALRHTAATELYRETHDIMKVKTFMRHSKVATTERYLKRLGVELEEEDYRTPGDWLT